MDRGPVTISFVMLTKVKQFHVRGFYGKADLESATNKQRSEIWDLLLNQLENLHEVNNA